MLLSKEHRILENGLMQFRPFGIDEQGVKVRDVTGIAVRARVEWLEESVARKEGQAAAEQAVAELVWLLNGRIPDPAYHVTSEFLRNPWNSYTFEFVMFMAEFCEDLAGDPEFHKSLAREKLLPSVIRILGRPFPIHQIYRMFPYFMTKYTKGGVIAEVLTVTERTAVMRIRLPEATLRQLGRYRRRCTQIMCTTTKWTIAAVPERIFRQTPAQVEDLSCMADGDDCCEWRFTWTMQTYAQWLAPLVWIGVGISTLLYLRVAHPAVSWLEAVLLSVPMFVTAALVMAYRRVQRTLKVREDIIQEQLRTVDVRQEELREAYLVQQQAAVDLKRRVRQLTFLHQTGVMVSATLDRELLIKNALQAIKYMLHYDRVIMTFFDHQTGWAGDARVIGAQEEAVRWIRTRSKHVTDPTTLDGRLLLKGEAVVFASPQEVAASIATVPAVGGVAVAQSVIAIPLKINERVMGALAVERLEKGGLNDEDLELITTVASQVAIALDNTEAYQRIEESYRKLGEAYRQIETLNVGLEAKVGERTAQLEKAVEQLKNLDRVKSQFLAHVSHELRTPLTSIKGFAENMLNGLTGTLTSKQEQYLGRITANVARLSRMIADLLERSRLESGTIQLAFEEVNLVWLVVEIVEQLRPLAVNKRQCLEVQGCAKPLVVWADTDRLSQILVNLIENAIKYTPEQGRIRVEIAAESPSLAGVAVTDTGAGIPEEALPKLFDPFFRVSQPGNQQKGLGLGLSIAKELAERQGGTIVVRSRLGEGSCFHLTLPLHVAVAGMPGRLPTIGKRVLVVDDDPDIRQVLADWLEAEGYAVRTVAEGREALRMLEVAMFDCMILDIGMPVLDGLETLRQLRVTHPRLPVVMITAAGSRGRAVMAIEGGAQDYLLKPFEMSDLKRVVNYWVNQTDTQHIS